MIDWTKPIREVGKTEPAIVLQEYVDCTGERLRPVLVPRGNGFDLSVFNAETGRILVGRVIGIENIPEPPPVLDWSGELETEFGNPANRLADSGATGYPHAVAWTDGTGYRRIDAFSDDGLARDHTVSLRNVVKPAEPEYWTRWVNRYKDGPNTWLYVSKSQADQQRRSDGIDCIEIKIPRPKV